MLRRRFAKLFRRRLLVSACLAALLAVVQAGCGDTPSSGFVCDAAYCIDCIDSCCYDLGYC